jgi:hypothetical protein
MTITPEKYIRKPLVVLGVQVTNENFMELALWVQGSIFKPDGTQGGEINPDKQYILVRVHNPKSPRQSRAFVGDWVLYSDRGYKVYSPKAFKNTFEPLTEKGQEREEPAREAKRDEDAKALRMEMEEASDEAPFVKPLGMGEEIETREERLNRLDRLKKHKVGGDDE